MSIRVLLGCLYVLGFAIYARRNWFISLCALVCFMAVNQHPDMPRSLGGIQGLNLWNILMFSVLVCWLFLRRQQGLVWDMPRHIQFLLFLYFTTVSVSFLRLFLNPGGWWGRTAGFVVSEYFVNCFKWALPGLILFDTCRTRKLVIIAAASILALYLLLALQVVKHVPLSAALSDDFSRYAYKQVENSVGYNRVTLSMMLSGACWAMLSTLVLAERRVHKWAIVGAAGLIALAQALTGGRSGYVSWAVVGLILGCVRWRRLLPLIPVAVAAVIIFLPAVRDRMLQGTGGGQVDQYELTSGRTIAWPYVIEKIQEGPWIGFGREAMNTTGVSQRIMEDYPEELFGHPHNAYLEALLDNGIIGFLGIIPFYLVALRHAFRLLLDRQNALASAVGGIACSLILALLVGAMGGQTFYPREGAVGLWAALGVMFRLSVEQARSRRTGQPLFGEAEQRPARFEITGPSVGPVAATV